MSDIHGVIACAGNGRRFAASVGSAAPYPKHLAVIGDRSILARVTDGLIRHVPVSGITFTLNDRLKDIYLPYLRGLQLQHPDVPFSYTIPPPDDVDHDFSRLDKKLKGNISTLGGVPMDLGDPILAATYGDTFLGPGNTNQLRAEIEEYLPYVKDGGNFILIGGGDFFSAHRLYQIYAPRNWSEAPGRCVVRYAEKYGMQCWNINDFRDAKCAEQELGYGRTIDEITSGNPPAYRK